MGFEAGLLGKQGFLRVSPQLPACAAPLLCVFSATKEREWRDRRTEDGAHGVKREERRGRALHVLPSLHLCCLIRAASSSATGSLQRYHHGRMGGGWRGRRLAGSLACVCVCVYVSAPLLSLYVVMMNGLSTPLQQARGGHAQRCPRPSSWAGFPWFCPQERPSSFPFSGNSTFSSSCGFSFRAHSDLLPRAP